MSPAEIARNPIREKRRVAGKAISYADVLLLDCDRDYLTEVMYFRLDQLGKNILRDFFVLVGLAETEVEVPAGDAQRIDVWHVPDPELLEAHPEIEPGLLRSMAAEPGWSRCRAQHRTRRTSMSA